MTEPSNRNLAEFEKCWQGFGKCPHKETITGLQKDCLLCLKQIITEGWIRGWNDAIEGQAEREKELQSTIDLIRDADMRGIKLWQESTGRTLEWPDRGKMIFWLLERDATKDEAAEIVRQRYAEREKAGDRQIENYRISLISLISRQKAAVAAALREAVEKLKEHWLFAIECDHEGSTDRAVCSCTWHSESQLSVGEAVARWIEHLALITPDRQIALDRHDAETREKVLGLIRALVKTFKKTARDHMDVLSLYEADPYYKCAAELERAIQESENAAK